jgi:hypothetical protein
MPAKLPEMSPSQELTDRGRKDAFIPSLESQREEGEIHASLDWDSPADTDNPKNWSFGQKVFHTSLPALYGLST